jgi:hypothetical protein
MESFLYDTFINSFSSQYCKEFKMYRKGKDIKFLSFQTCVVTNLPAPSCFCLCSFCFRGEVSSRTGSFRGFCISLGYRIPCGLFTPGSFYPVVFANCLVLKDLAKWRDFQFSRIFHRLLTYEGWHLIFGFEIKEDGLGCIVILLPFVSLL